MKKWILKTKAVFLACVMMASCTQAPVSSKTPELTFDHLNPISLPVNRVEIVEQFQPGMTAPQVEHLFPVPPYRAVHSLLKQRLKAEGVTDNILRVVIEDASVIEEKLPRTEGIMGAFIKEPDVRYKGRIVIRFELASAAAPDIVRAHADVTADRTKTVFENVSLLHRQRAWFEMTEAMLRDVDRGLDEIVKPTFGRAQH